MNREFLEFYDRELKLLYERSKEFAEEFPGVAARLGALTEDQMDPTLVGLLEGAAFLAARVQLKIKSEFDTFTVEMLEHLLPGFLAPIPSFAMVRAMPDFSDPGLRDGVFLKAGDYLDTAFVEREKRIACRYRLVTDLTLWPYEISKAEYFSTPAPMQARGIETSVSVASGLCLELVLRGGPPAKDTTAGPPAKSCTPDELTFHLVESISDSATLYELLFSKLGRIIIRHAKAGSAPRFEILPGGSIEEIGFEEGRSLFGHDDRVFAGFNQLKEYFLFPHRFLGFRLKGLADKLKHIDADRIEIYFEFESSSKRMSSIIKAKSFALYAAPVANLFEATCTPVPLRTQDHEHVVVVDRSRPLEYEIYKILEVSALFPRRKDKIPVFPLYSAPRGNMPLNKAHFYTSRQIERRRTDAERRTGLVSNYLGTDTFISLREPAEEDVAERVRSLNVRALVTNRHLTDQLPVRRGRADFVAVSDTKLEFECIAGPTPPKDSLLSGTFRGRGAEPTGSVLWKLINFLQFNHLGLAGRPGGDGAAALREMLMVFADTSNADIERRIRGIVNVSTEPVVRKIRQDTGYNAARGIRVTIEVDETAFEGSGAFLLGTILSKFLTEYASINSFVETAMRSRQRGEIKVWKPVVGERRLL